jgi:hypothetical protein
MISVDERLRLVCRDPRFACVARSPPKEAMMVRALFFLAFLVGCNDKGDDSGGTATDDSTPSVDDADGDGFVAPADCDDGDATIHPSATEVCDTVDNDCDGTVDVGAADATAYYTDGDGDTYGAGKATMSCTPVAGLVENGDDCDDGDAAIHPEAVEVCDELDADEDCDTLADDEDDSVDTSTATLTLYADSDGDAYGNDAATVAACDPISGYVAGGGDCDDSSKAVHPGAAEVCGDTIDDDCDGLAPGCGWSGVLAPEDADVEIPGPYEGVGLGVDSTNTGDVNGDGANDLAVATYTADGVAYLFLGPISGSPAPAATFLGSKNGDSVGHDVQGIGDQDGDGYADLLLSAAPFPDYNYQGRAYVVLGPVTGEHVVEDDADAMFQGDTFSEMMGWAPSAGDVNGDGVVDLMLGGPNTNAYTGGSYVYFGPVTTGTYQFADADLSFSGNAKLDFTGGSNSANGDVDGDGIDDMLIGAEMASYSGDQDGMAWFFYGPMSGEHSVTEADAVVYGADSGAHLGWMGSIGGDLDGDGLDDVAVSAPHPNDAGIGWLYVFSATKALGRMDVSAANATIEGDKAADGFARYFDTAGDLDSDGYDDLAVGSPIPNVLAGKAWGYYGPLTGTMSASADAAFIVEGSEAFGSLGDSTVFVGDVTGDGLDDLAIGAHGASTSSVPHGGAVYLFAGR